MKNIEKIILIWGIAINSSLLLILVYLGIKAWLLKKELKIHRIN